MRSDNKCKIRYALYGSLHNTVHGNKVDRSASSRLVTAAAIRKSISTE